jgi:uncharacterized protein (TIGR03086 family)
MTQPSTIVVLDQLAVRGSLDIVNRATIADLGLPTPCDGWTLADLLAHMVAQHSGFARASRGEVDELSFWAARPLGDDAVPAYRLAANDVMDAFARPGVLDQPFWLPEIRDGGPFPATTAIAFHLVDYVVHGWDVAVTIGAAPSYPAEVLEAALAIAQQVPDGDVRDLPGSAFRRGLPAGDGRTVLDRILLLLGREPSWSTPEIA